MELVQAFNAELSTLYEVKPPISKAKMSSITKTAIKAIKMYKHIVQSVERFIAKCRPEYKVPGLYVVDSIVRQSRHQFGHDKDVFGPRFTRNFNQTFQNLFLTCPVDDKPKIVRVLNLWQRNNVFSCDVIQPLLDMANPNADLKQVSSSPSNENVNNDNASQDANIVMHLQQLASTLGLSKNSNGSNMSIGNDNQIRFNKKLLDFDYGDDDDDEKGETPTESEPPLSMSMTGTSSEDLNANPLALSMAQNLLSNPELFQKLKQSIAMQSDSVKNELFENTSSSFFNSNNINNDFTEQLYNLRDSLKLVQNKSNNSNFIKDQNSDFDLNQNLNQNKINSHDKRELFDKNDSNKDSKSRISSSPSRKYSSKHRESTRCSRKEERISYRNDKSRNDRERRDKRSSRERKSHRSRSRSPRVNSTKKDVNFQTVSSTELKEKERERERRKKGLPNVKKNYVTICSTTLWLGHLPKSTTEVDISDAFGEYGTINTIDLISARGCAYVCMNRRQDAFKALQNLKNLKLHGSHLKMAWAPGKGMKGKEFKDYWDVEIGVSMIPYEKLNADTDFELLEDGSMVDEESMPPDLLEIRNKKLKENKQQNDPVNNTTNPIVSNIPIVSMPSVPNPFSLSIPPGLVPLPPLPVRVGPPMLGPIPPMIPPPSATLMNPNSHPSLIPPPPPPQISCPIKNEDHFKIDNLSHNNNLPKNQSPSQASIFPPMTLNVPPPNLHLPNNNKNSIPWLSGVPPPSINNLPPLQPPFLKEDNHKFYPGKEESLNENVFDPFSVNKSNNNTLIPQIMPYDEQQNNFHFENMNNSDRINQNYGRDNWKRKDQRRDRNTRYNNNSKSNYSDFKNDNRSNYNDNRLNKRKRRDDNFNTSWNNNSIKSNSRNRRRDYHQKSENYSSSNDNDLNNQTNQNNVNDDNKDDNLDANKFSVAKNSIDNLNENESNDHNLLKAIET